MSLSRLALRLATVEALCPFAAQASGAFPTLAGREVSDTPIDPIESVELYDALMARIEGKAVVSVYTEEFAAEPYEPATFPAEQAIVTLVVETMIATRGTLVVQGADGASRTFGTVEAAITDRTREAMLDVLEAQVEWVLSRGSTGELFRRVLMEARRLHSVPQRSDEKTIRLAARTWKLTCKVRNTAWRPPLPGATGLDLLPEPLRTVGRALDPASSGGKLCLALADVVPRPGTPGPLFAGLDFATVFGGAAVQAPFDLVPPPA